MNRKVVFKTADGWMVRYEGPHAAAIVAVMGTATLPLPFTAQAKAETVLGSVQMRSRKQGEACEVVYEIGLSWTSIPGEVA